MRKRPALWVGALWVRCGRCAGEPNLATITGPGMTAVWPRRNGRWVCYPRKGSPTEFTHMFTCKLCGASEKVSGERLDRWWAEFAATGRQRDVRYLFRDR